MMKGKFSFGKKNKDSDGSELEKEISAPVDTDDSSQASEGSSKNMFGFEKKKPRAEFQAEIDELKVQLEFANSELSRAKSDLRTANAKVAKYERWARSAPM